MTDKLIAWFSQIDKDDIPIVGGKGANTGEMVKAGFPVPPGFIVTAAAYYLFLEKTGLQKKIRKLLENLDVNDPVELKKASDEVKKLIVHGKIPESVKEDIFKHYSQLGEQIAKTEKNPLKKINRFFSDTLVAVRSSATAEDLPNASFAGQQETYLNIKGEANVVQAVRKCWASLFEARAIYYRAENKFDHFKVGIAVLVQQMVESEKSGVMFTIDPTTNDKKIAVIEAIYGLGEYIVQGIVTPDHYEVEKSSLEITKKELACQKAALQKKGNVNKKVRVPVKLQEKQKITDKEIKELTKFGKKLEHHYYFPQDIEWAIAGKNIYIVQTRPITTIKKTNTANLETGNTDLTSLKKLKLLLTGAPASPGIVYGKVKILRSPKEMNKLQEGDILTAEQTNPDYVPAMKKAGGIITDKGGRTSHAAIVSRELGIPCIVGTEKATKILKDDEVVTMDAGVGKIYQGSPQIGSRKLVFNLKQKAMPAGTLKTATKLYVNLAEPEIAEIISKRDVEGVGLLRAEFMIANIGIHPKKLINDKKSQFFVDKMSEQLEMFCKSFSPRPVVYRATDFKTNEYRNLKGGKLYEPVEPNPMLGYRGAFRYIHDPQVFKLEIDALKKVRNKLGYKNLHLMIPFVRTVKELLGVKRLLASYGLMRSPSFKLWIMVEIPSNVILLDKFIEAGIDGVSIGSNDLTMLILGTDRDNSDVASEFDERNEAVLWALEKIVRTCHKNKITCSICGQAPSDYPDLVEKLVDWGITSMSVNPDVIEKTREIIYEAEKRVIGKK